MTPLQIACKNKNDNLVSLLVENIDADSLVKPSVVNFPLHLLCKSKTEKLSLIELILKKLKSASEKKGSKNYIKFALKAVDSNEMSLLLLAVEYGHVHIVEKLFGEYKVDSKHQDKDGEFYLQIISTFILLIFIELFLK